MQHSNSPAEKQTGVFTPTSPSWQMHLGPLLGLNHPPVWQAETELLQTEEPARGEGHLRIVMVPSIIQAGRHWIQHLNLSSSTSAWLGAINLLRKELAGLTFGAAFFSTAGTISKTKPHYQQQLQEERVRMTDTGAAYLPLPSAS